MPATRGVAGIVGNNDQLQSNQLISGKQDHRTELSNIAQIGNLPSKEASASMLSEVTDHFKATFSNVAKGEASASEYIEVGALVAGTAALGAFAAGRLMQRNAPAVFSRSENLASSATTRAATTGYDRTHLLACGLQDTELLAGKHAPALNSSNVRAALEAAEKGTVSVPRNQAAVDLRNALATNKGKSFSWRAPQGSEGARFEVSEISLKLSIVTSVHERQSQFMAELDALPFKSVEGCIRNGGRGPNIARICDQIVPSGWEFSHGRLTLDGEN